MNSPEKLPTSFLDKIARDSKSALLAVAAFCLPMFFLMLGAWPFFDPDEGRYSAIPREMLMRGDWVTPTLNFVTYIEKPPLLYWGTMLSFLAFGFNETSGRLVPAICALLGVLFTYGVGRRMFGSRAGLLGAVILATTIFWAVMARQLIIDPLLAATVWGAIAFWWLAQSEGENGEHIEAASTREAPARNVETRRTLWMIGFWAMMALGVLAKGPVGAILPLGVAFLYAAACNRWREFFRLKLLLGLPLFLLISAPWFVLVQQRNPGFNEFFWYGQNVARFLGKGANREHVEPPYYFLMWLPLVFFPWSLFLPGALATTISRWKARRQRRAAGIATSREYSQRARAAIFLLIATVFITAFFSISTSKLITYILPALPPLALLLGYYFDELLGAREDVAWRAPLKSGVALLGAFVLLLGIAAAAAGPKALLKYEGVSSVWPYILAIISLAWCVALFLFMKRRRLNALLASVAIGSTLLFVSAIQIVALAVPNHTMRVLAQAMEPGLQKGAGVLEDGFHMPSVGFYSGKRLAVGGAKSGELSFGRDHLSAREKTAWFPPSEGDLLRLMRQNRPMYCLMRNRKSARKLTQKYPELVEIAWNGRRAVVGNKLAAAITPPRGNVMKPDSKK